MLQNIYGYTPEGYYVLDLTMPSTLAAIIDGEGDIFGQLEELTSLEPVLR